MKTVAFLILIFHCSSYCFAFQNNSNYQTGLSYLSTGELDSASYYFKLSAKESLKQKAYCDYLAAKREQSILLNYNKDYSQILEVINEIKEVAAKNVSTLTCSFNVELDYISSLYYYSKSDYDSALFHLEAFIKAPIIQRNDSAVAFHDMGLIYQERGEYKKAKDYYLYAYSAKKKSISNENFGALANSIAVVSYYLRDFPSATKYYAEAASEYSKIYTKKHPRIATVYNNLAHIKTATQQFDSALYYHNEALSIRLEKLPKNHIHTIASRNGLGILYYQTKGFEKAKIQFESCVSMLKELNDPSYDKFLFSTLVNLSHVQRELLSFEAALKHLEAAKNLIKSSQEIQIFNANDDIIIIRESLNTLNQWRAMNDHIDLLNKQLEVVSTIGELDGQQAKVISNYEYETDFLIRITDIYELSLPILVEGYQNGDIEAQTVFNTLEKTKSNLFRKHLYREEALRYGGIDQSLLNEEADLRSKIVRLQIQDSIDHDQLFKTQRAYDRNLTKIQKANPSLFKLKFSDEFVDLASLREKLAEINETMILYHYDDKQLNTIVLNSDTLVIKQASINNDFEGKIKALRENISQNSSLDSIYYSNSNDLYNALIDPIKDLLDEKIIIVPHGLLNHIPFEVLITNDPSAGQNSKNYLLESYSVSYANSADLWFQSRVSEGLINEGSNILAIAPDFSQSTSSYPNREDLSPLQWSRKEAESLSTHFEDVLITQNSEAETLKGLLDGKTYEIVHFATHGLLDDSKPLNSELVLSGVQKDGYQKISVRELFEYNIDADLVVLSACNSGYGDIINGEGSITMARGFFYAGVNSVVHSLWNVNDYSSSIFMDLFYQQLSEDVTKDEALRNAKINYLKDSDEIMSHPYYWSGYVLNGNIDKKLITKENSNLYWILLSLVSVLAVVLVWIRLKKSLEISRLQG